MCVYFYISLKALWVMVDLQGMYICRTQSVAPSTVSRVKSFARFLTLDRSLLRKHKSFALPMCCSALIFTLILEKKGIKGSSWTVISRSLHPQGTHWAYFWGWLISLHELGGSRILLWERPVWSQEPYLGLSNYSKTGRCLVTEWGSSCRIF